MDVTALKESRMYTTLSFSAFKNHPQCFKIVYKHAKKYNLDILNRQALQDWVNTPTDEKFTALHFATYHGNFELIQIMCDEMGANMFTKNVYGANVLHIAAQGDAPCPLYYFAKIKNMNINDVDNRGSTPLHWACYSKSEYALSYLLAMGPNLEA